MNWTLTRDFHVIFSKNAYTYKVVQIKLIKCLYGLESGPCVCVCGGGGPPRFIHVVGGTSPSPCPTPYQNYRL